MGDPSVLDFSYPSRDGEPPWSNEPTERFAFDLALRLHPKGNPHSEYFGGLILTNDPFSTIRANQHVF